MKQGSKNQTRATPSLRAVLWLFLCFLATSVQADIRAFKAEYEVTYMRMRAAAVTIALEQQDDDNWFMSRKSKAIGLARLIAKDKLDLQEQSWFEINDSNLIANKFLLEKPGAKKGRRRIEINFSETQATVETDDEESKAYDKTEHSQDQVSAVMAVMLKMQKQMEDFSMPIMARRGESIASFEVLEGGSVKTPAGVFDTVYIVQKNKKRTTSYWLAKEHNMVPVKILHQEKDKESAVMLLKKLKVSDQ